MLGVANCQADERGMAVVRLARAELARRILALPDLELAPCSCRKLAPTVGACMTAPLQTTISAAVWSWSWWQALSTRVPGAEMSTHLDSASASHRRAAASLLHQSELAWRFRCRPQSVYAGS